MITFNLNTAALSYEIERLVKTTGKEALQVVLEEGKLLATDLVKLTPPFGGAPSSESFNAQRKVGENAAERDVKRSFVLVDSTKIRDRRIRKDLETAVRKGDAAAVKTILQFCKIPVNEVLREADPAVHERFRDRRGRVQKWKRVWVLRGRGLKQLIRLKRSHVGKAKAGWAAAAQALGARLPAWITRHGTSGGSFEITKGNEPKITLRNQVPYIQTTGGDLRVVERALRNRVRNIRAKLERIARSGWKKK